MDNKDNVLYIQDIDLNFLILTTHSLYYSIMSSVLKINIKQAYGKLSDNHLVNILLLD